MEVLGRQRLLQLLPGQPLEVLEPEAVALEVRLAGHDAALEEEGLYAALRLGAVLGEDGLVDEVRDGDAADDPGVHVDARRVVERPPGSLWSWVSTYSPDNVRSDLGERGWEGHPYLVQRLVRRDGGSRELPPPLLPHNNQIKRPLKLPIQPPHIALLVRLRHPLYRPLDRHPLINRDLLRIITNPRHRVLQNRLPQRLGARELVPDPQLVVPRAGRPTVVLPDLARHDAVALLELKGPIELRRGVALEEGGLREGERQPLVEPLLVEVEGVLEGRLRPREQRGAREDHARLDEVPRGAVGRGRRRRGRCFRGGGGVGPERGGVSSYRALRYESGRRCGIQLDTLLVGEKGTGGPIEAANVHLDAVIKALWPLLDAAILAVCPRFASSFRRQGICVAGAAAAHGSTMQEFLAFAMRGTFFLEPGTYPGSLDPFSASGTRPSSLTLSH